MKRSTFTVQPSSTTRRCARCTMPLRAGQRATVIREDDGIVTFRHAGRTCPSLRPDPPFPTRYVN